MNFALQKHGQIVLIKHTSVGLYRDFTQQLCCIIFPNSLCLYWFANLFHKI